MGLGRFLLLVGVAAIAACAAPSATRPPLGTTDTEVRSGFAAAPADVLVARVRDTSGAQASPREPLRRALYAGLVTKLFSPVQLDYVDRRADSPRGPVLEGPHEAVLRAHVVRWDADALESRGYVDVEVEAELARPTGAAEILLWRSFLSRRLELTTAEVRRTAQADQLRILSERLAAEILAQLPARGSVPPEEPGPDAPAGE